MKIPFKLNKCFFIMHWALVLFSGPLAFLINAGPGVIKIMLNSAKHEILNAPKN